MATQCTINQRLRQYLKFERTSLRLLSEEIGMSESTLSSKFASQNAVDIETLIKIVERHKSISLDWLLFGSGKMLRDESPSAISDELKDLCTEQALEIRRLKLRIAELEAERERAASTIA